MDGHEGAPDTPDTRPAGVGPAPARRWGLVAAAGVVVLLLDQLTKAWALDALCLAADGSCVPGDPTAAPVHVLWTLQWNLAFNTGMAFSRGAGAGPIIGLVAIGIVVVLGVLARKVTSRFQLVVIGVVMGGALGNVVDRLLRAEDGFMSGAVVDFIDLQWWPIFNVADAAVVVGGLLLALLGLRMEDPAEDPAPVTSAAPEAGDPGEPDAAKEP